eukprot:TRINITY_DN3671_c0_g1_i2.p1 TRINITY_DN3671_c0_g1~~TRINITY_DN3671_c0_g1_i2.p1  ORF type:complete len:616 (+),score=136.78 TRINITY_DN3671_c0_g1_i2:120-1967(+)
MSEPAESSEAGTSAATDETGSSTPPESKSGVFRGPRLKLPLGGEDLRRHSYDASRPASAGATIVEVRNRRSADAIGGVTWTDVLQEEAGAELTRQRSSSLSADTVPGVTEPKQRHHNSLKELFLKSKSPSSEGLLESALAGEESRGRKRSNSIGALIKKTKARLSSSGSDSPLSPPPSPMPMSARTSGSPIPRSTIPPILLRIQYAEFQSTVIRRSSMTLAATLQVLLAKKDVHIELQPELCYFTLSDSDAALNMTTCLCDIEFDTVCLKQAEPEPEDEVNSSSGKRRSHRHHRSSLLESPRVRRLSGREGTVEVEKASEREAKETTEASIPAESSESGDESESESESECCTAVTENTTVDTEEGDKTEAQMAPLSEEEKREQHRGMVWAELVQTEEHYIQDLKMIMEIFLVPIQLEHLITDAETLALFSSWGMMVSFHQDLLIQLQKGEDLIATSFANLERGPFVRLMEIYCANYKHSIEAVMQRREDPDFRKFLLSSLQDPRLRGLDLKDFLILPLQRLCKYPLLLKDLLRSTPESNNAARDSIAKALESVQRIAECTNEYTSMMESFEKLADAQKRLEDGAQPLPFKLAVPGRKFIRELSVQEVTFCATLTH